ncbi:MAG: sigma-70 family RNA polymerase sigma factor [Bacteroidetes bacterium]|nr:sigma-70 family RNA polymerase sigma factor [Bacteroidota bacterium]
MDITDQEILEKFAVESTQQFAFNLLVKKYQEKLYWHVRRMVINHEDTNDLIQEIFIKVWKNLHKFRGDSKLYTYLYRIATNETLTFLNKKKRKYFLPLSNVEKKLEEELVASTSFDPDKLELKLQKAILSLPTKQRLIFNMRYYDDLSYEEISQMVNTSVGALKASYHHAAKKVEKFIIDD